ncbi:MAG: UvrB/UvrC motif-containing protein [Candidatus Omnitrophica bacterium]|nr:UvrB/UvrC motif-containing protein [Candidatus Omnitrophota bacterium]
MKCDYCENKATLEIIEVHGDKISEHHICETCLAGILNEIMRLANRHQPVSRMTKQFHRQPQAGLLICENCGECYRPSANPGGSLCPDCSREVPKILKSSKKKSRPKDKSPHFLNRLKHVVDQNSQDAKIDILRKELKSAIEKEEYEKAAHLRDAIKKIEHNN